MIGTAEVRCGALHKPKGYGEKLASPELPNELSYNNITNIKWFFTNDCYRQYIICTFLQKGCFHRLLYTVCIAAFLFSVLIRAPIFFFRIRLPVIRGSVTHQHELPCHALAPDHCLNSHMPISHLCFPLALFYRSVTVIARLCTKARP